MTKDAVSGTPENDGFQVKVEDFLRDQDEAEKSAIEATILFADLAGSTEFKRDNEVLDGFAKVVTHNKVVSNAIRECEGNVVKYIGDEVMGIFHGSNGATNALRAGLRIIEDIEKKNASKHWRFPRAMSTRIGINHGKVWLFKYPESKVEDPQGVAVDKAARVASMAPPQHIVCTEETFNLAKIDFKGFHLSDGKNVFLKGFDNLHSLRVLAPKSEELCLDLAGHGARLSKFLTPDLQFALKLRREEKYQEAREKFQEILDRDEGNFHANLYSAELIIRELGFNNLDQIQREELLKSAHGFLCRAKYAHSSSSRLWLLMSWIRFKEFELKGDVDRLETAIRYAGDSLNCAQLELNHTAAIQAKTYLANYLLARSKCKKETASKDLAEALNLCGEVEAVIHDSLDSYRVDFLVTHAEVRLANKDSNTEAIEELINEALRLDPKYVRAYRVKAALVQQDGNGPTGFPRI